MFPAGRHDNRFARFAAGFFRRRALAARTRFGNLGGVAALREPCRRAPVAPRAVRIQPDLVFHAPNMNPILPPGRLSRFLLVLLLCAGCTATPAPHPPRAAIQPVRVYIVSGQSNAVGYNHVKDYHGGREPFPEELRVQPRVLYWDGVESATNRWTTLRTTDAGSFGPEIGLSHDLQAAMPGATIAIVKFAVGGTGIARSTDYDDYIPSLAHFDDHGRNWHPPSDGRDGGLLYAALLRNVRAALAGLEAQGRRWELCGFVWMQGEHEGGISPRMAKDYEGLLSGFIGAVRGDLHAPGLPFAVGEINSHTWAFGDIARRSQAEACRKDPRAVLVPTMDLPRNAGAGGPAHFDADGTLALGSRFARALRDLNPTRNGGKVETGK